MLRLTMPLSMLAALAACGTPADLDGGLDASVVEAGLIDAGLVDADLIDADLDAASDDAGNPSGWRMETPTPLAIQEIAVESHEGRIWVAGGLDATATVVPTVRIYDPATGEWTLGPDLPAARHHMNLVSHGGDLYALGGMQTLAFEPLDTAWVLRAGSDAWTSIATLPEDRGAAAADSVAGLLVMAGGNGARGGLADATLVYDPVANAWRTAAPIPTPREHLAAVAVADELYVLAGRRNSLDTTRTELEIYDPVADTWRAGPELPYPRGGFDAALLDGELYVVGGEEPTRVLRTVDRLDIASATWSAAPPTLQPHHGHGVAALGGRLYVIAGADRPTFGAFAEVESYAP